MIADKIMNWCWGRKGYGWDKGSPAHRFWKRQVNKKKRSVKWWKKNWERIYNKKIYRIGDNYE